eukprot:TRINITY_DN10579_c0_g1_i2.p2 TRINITY_DN10579_c0_g1~~TRINITY_DN10579_c0_g1_i2.p2  ORF type:complete len:238 (-),score=64.79 TRINITY_DN10579_c0_g1_i2:192-905(-)
MIKSVALRSLFYTMVQFYFFFFFQAEDGIRDVERSRGLGDVYKRQAMTCTLLTNSQGQKMGKTVGGALWLNPEKTSPYDFYQYWRNVDDADVEKCLALLTFLPMDEVRRLGALEGSEINKAKEILAYEVTKLVHGEEEAKKAEEAAKALFAGGADMSNVPTVTIGKDDLGKTILDILAASKVIPSKKEGRRLIEQGGLSINGVKVQDVNRLLVEEDFEDNIVLTKKKKKKKKKKNSA